MRTPLTPLAFPPQGRPGAPGLNTGFGQVTYTERSVEADDSFAAGVRQQVRFVPTPSLTQDLLNAPFAGHTFWSDNRLIGRAMGDLIDVTVNLIVTATIAGGQLRTDADVGSTLGPVASDSQTLFNGAGIPERTTFRLRLQVLAGFLANGCALFLTSNVPLLVTSETVLVAPASIRPAA
ncbi:hypothetical protein [Methylobacterium soli]|uniref:Uncharacterized protein n=1 Tax=Methylobacterium soli TaxID=553447 RepID=A0A6L3SZ42_9HYPH|nr:hypothetical protein [Methylobacterium soli]KAB1079399.1 hypothetical protein F6X53_11390 [Methylobacterium soli]GJE42075.1 hypothetical protein AEGHOMDF_1246 [Methylobacterium soli]